MYNPFNMSFFLGLYELIKKNNRHTLREEHTSTRLSKHIISSIYNLKT
jgi:hypothetical protein